MVVAPPHTCLSPLVPHPDITGKMRSGDDGICNTGDEVSYEIVVKNTGNNCLEDVTVTDALSGSIVCASSAAGTPPAFGHSIRDWFAPDISKTD